jgi:orotate phosphoribosyltransferase
MRQYDVILQALRDREVLLGPGHYILGDGYGNPGLHSSYFINWQRFNKEVDLYAELVQVLAQRVLHIRFDAILTPDPDSLPTARMLAKVISEDTYGPPAPCISAEGGRQPEFKTNTLTPVLIHDDFINNGRQANELLLSLDRTQYQPVAISALFTRVATARLFDLPIYAAVDEAILAYRMEEVPEELAQTPINVDLGKGRIYLQRQADQLRAGLKKAAGAAN